MNHSPSEWFSIYKKARREAAASRRAYVVYFWRLRAPAPQRRGMATTTATPSARPTAIFRVSAPLAAAAAKGAETLKIAVGLALGVAVVVAIPLRWGAGARSRQK